MNSFLRQLPLQLPQPSDPPHRSAGGFIQENQAL